MLWSEFLTKVKTVRAMKKPLGFNIGVVTRLIWSGSFNSSLVSDPACTTYMQMLPFERYRLMTADIAKALGSTARLPKSSKTEPIGVCDIDSEAALILWRHIVNPLFTWPLSEVPSFQGMLKEIFSFTPNFQGKYDADGKMQIPYVKNRVGKASYDLYRSWEFPFDNPNLMSEYRARTPQRKAAIIGIIVSVKRGTFEDKKTKEMKPRANIIFFDGFKEYEISMWPSWDTGTLNAAIMSDLKPTAFGVLVIKPEIYRGKKGGALTSFYKMSL